MADRSNQMQSAEDFQLLEVSLYSDRLTNTINITNLVAEINIFEQLNQIFLTGKITILDDNNVFEIVNIQGTELLDIKLKLPTSDSAVIEKTFAILNVDKIIKTNDHANVLQLSLREAKGYYADLYKFSKAYDGAGESIIQKIAQDQLNTAIFGFDWRDNNREPQTFQRSLQKRFRYMVPYSTPIEAIKTVVNKMTTGVGMPYFISSAFLTDDLILRDLETILLDPSFNEKRPFVYSQSATQSKSHEQYAISKFEASNVEDTLLLSQLGAIGSSYNITELRSGKTEKTRLDMNTVFDRLKQLKIIDKKDEAFIDNFLQPEKFILGKSLRQQNTENKLGDFNSKIFDDISGDTYEEDVLNYTEENYISDYKLRPISRAIKNHLLKNTIDITLPGLEFLIADNIKTSVGYKINVEIFKSDINDLSKQNSKLSGEFIILAKRHIFDCAAFKHKVSLNCGRITKQQEI